MPRIIVISDAPDEPPQILLNEEVSILLMGDPHSSIQVLERVAWAVEDAEVVELRSAINAHSDNRRRNRVEGAVRRLRFPPAQDYTADAIGA